MRALDLTSLKLSQKTTSSEPYILIKMAEVRVTEEDEEEWDEEELMLAIQMSQKEDDHVPTEVNHTCDSEVITSQSKQTDPCLYPME